MVKVWETLGKRQGKLVSSQRVVRPPFCDRKVIKKLVIQPIMHGIELGRDLYG